MRLNDGRNRLHWLAGVFMLLTAFAICAAAAAEQAADAQYPAKGYFADITAGAVQAVLDEAYDPLGAELALSSTEMTGAGNCAATVTVSNQGDDVIGDVTIYDSSGAVIWGPRDIDMGETYIWRGTLDVTDAMLDSGTIACDVSYVLAKGDAEYEQTIRKTITSPLDRVEAQPAMEFSRSQSTTYAQPGQRITLTYTIKNTGNVSLKDIVVTDSLFGTVDTLDSLDVDAKKTFTKRVTVGTTALTSSPSVQYSYDGSQDIIEKEIASSSIRIAQPSLEVVLESDATLVNPGDTVMLRCKLINNGNVGYKKIQLSDQVLGDLGFIDDLKAGKDTVYAKAVRVQSRTTYKFTITAKDTTGSDVTAVSNSLTIDVVSKSGEQSLTLSAQADKTAVNSGDVVTFTLMLCNNGTADISNIDIAERTRGVIARVELLRAGESMPLTAQYTVTGYEMFTFSATMTQQDGATREALAEPITISLGGPTPEPSPTAEPSPTPLVTVAPSLLRAYDNMFNHVLTYVLAFAVCLLIVLVVMFSVNRANDKKRQQAADTGRAKHGGRRTGKGKKRRGKNQKAPPVVVTVDDDDDVKVYVPARTLKEAEAASKAAPRQPRRGRHDRNAN